MGRFEKKNTPNFGCFFISSTEWVEKTEFGQGSKLRVNTVKGQN